MWVAILIGRLVLEVTWLFNSFNIKWFERTERALFKYRRWYSDNFGLADRDLVYLRKLKQLRIA